MYSFPQGLDTHILVNAHQSGYALFIASAFKGGLLLDHIKEDGTKIRLLFLWMCGDIFKIVLTL